MPKGLKDNEEAVADAWDQFEKDQSVSIQEQSKKHIDPAWDIKMSKIEGHKINAVPFSGEQKDWMTWSNKIQQALIVLGLLFIVMNPKEMVLKEIKRQQTVKCEQTGKSIDFEWLQRMMTNAYVRAHSMLIDGLTGLAQQHVKHIPPGEPYMVWQALSAGEYAKNTTTVASIRMKLFSLKLAQFASFQEFISTMREKQLLLAQAGQAPQDADMKAILLLGMKDDKDRAYVVRACHGDERNFEASIKAIKADIELEEARDDDDPTVETTSFHVHQGKGGPTTRACGKCPCCAHMWKQGWKDESRNNQTNDWKRNKKPCYQWTNTGKCRFGDSCRFSHDDEGGEGGAAARSQKDTCYNCGGTGHIANNCPSERVGKSNYSF